MKQYLRWMGLAAFAALAACGGGGGGDDGGTGGDPPPGAASYSVGGTLAGLEAGKSLVVANFRGGTGPGATLSANGAYSLTVPAGTTYDLRVVTQPADQLCAIANGTGVANAAVSNIAITCTSNANPGAFAVRGTVSGLGAGQSVTLVLTASGRMQEATAVAAAAPAPGAPFAFVEPVSGAYSVTLRTVPAGLGCAVANGEGTAAQEVTDIQVSCMAATYALGGTAAGLLQPVALRNTASGEQLAVPASGSFAFSQRVPHGGAYSVVIADAGTAQTCTLANAQGMAQSDVTVQLSCTAVVVSPPPPPPVPVPTNPTGLTVSYAIKSFNFSWNTVTGATSYRLNEDPDGVGPLPLTPVGGLLTGNTATYSVTGLLHTKLNAVYAVQACNAGGCGDSSGVIRPNLIQAIGYVKASNTGVSDAFGYALAVSGDGNTLAVGAPGERSNARGINGDQADNSAPGAGAVYVFARTAGGWTQQAYVKAPNADANDNFGTAVALSADGSTLAVGAPGEASSATGVGGDQANNDNAASGAVYVVVRNAAAAWTHQAYLKASNTGTGDQFGLAVALAGDGNTLAVGTYAEDSSTRGINGNGLSNGALQSGAAYVFVRNGTLWAQQAYVKASNTDAQDRFGTSIAMAADGNTLAVGASEERSNAVGINGDQADNSAGGAGAVYVFVRNAATWTQQAYVKASNTGGADQFGNSVALAANGSVLAVGAPGEGSLATGVNGNQADDSAGGAGAVYVFVRAGANWSQQAYVKASNPAAGDQFGFSVALSSDGNTLAAGAYFEDGDGNGLSGNQMDNSAVNSGAAYVFVRSGASWTQQAYVKARNTNADDLFGLPVALSADGGLLAVGAALEDGAGSGTTGDPASNLFNNAGAVYLY